MLLHVPSSQLISSVLPVFSSSLLVLNITCLLDCGFITQTLLLPFWTDFTSARLNIQPSLCVIYNNKHHYTFSSVTGSLLQCTAQTPTSHSCSQCGGRAQQVNCVVTSQGISRTGDTRKYRNNSQLPTRSLWVCDEDLYLAKLFVLNCPPKGEASNSEQTPPRIQPACYFTICTRFHFCTALRWNGLVCMYAGFQLRLTMLMWHSEPFIGLRLLVMKHENNS